MTVNRRTFLRAGMAAATTALAAGAGLLSPGRVLAAWPEQAFMARSLDDALAAMNLGGARASSEVTVEAPDIAENGAVVSVTVTTRLPEVESITVLVPKNTMPLISSYGFGPRTEGFITGRIKMRETSDVIGVVKAGGRLYMAKKPVKVTLGGCGG